MEQTKGRSLYKNHCYSRVGLVVEDCRRLRGGHITTKCVLIHQGLVVEDCRRLRGDHITTKCVLLHQMISLDFE
jgi:hypothetical protein